MIICDVEQGTEDWVSLRKGIPTCSEFDRIITPSGKLCKSEASNRYMHELLLERLLGVPVEMIMDETGAARTDWMKRGNELEPYAVKSFEFSTGLKCSQVGFILADNRLYGGSPDRLIGEEFVLEVKCPKPNTHVGYMLTPISLCVDYKVQVHGYLLVSGYTKAKMISHCPPLPDVIVDFPVDQEFLTKLAEALAAFCAQLNESHERLVEEYGSFAAPAEIVEYDEYEMQEDEGLVQHIMANAKGEE